MSQQRRQQYWIAKTPNGYVKHDAGQLPQFNARIDDATRRQTLREAQNMLLNAATLMIESLPVSSFEFERVEEVITIDEVVSDSLNVSQLAWSLYVLKTTVSDQVAEARRWMMTSKEYDYYDWNYAMVLPQWEYDEPDGETVEERLASIQIPAVICKNVVFVKREEDYAAMRLIFDDIRLFVCLVDAAIIVDNRS